MSTVLVDVGLGNVRSVERAVLAAAEQAGTGVSIVRSGDRDVIARGERLIFPGQGGFAHAADVLAEGVGEVLRDRIAAGVPFFGICIGLQVLFEGSEEAPGKAGLGVFSGQVRRLQGGAGLKVPHMGWNQLKLTGHARSDSAAEPRHPYLEAAGGEGAWVYFVHSYHAVPADRSILAATCDYGPDSVTAAVHQGNVFATQFHPEKSQRAGLDLLAAFLKPSTAV